MKKKLTQRNAFQPIDTTLTPDSPFPALVDYWLADFDWKALAPATGIRIQRDIDRLVLPPFQDGHARDRRSPLRRLAEALGNSSY